MKYTEKVCTSDYGPRGRIIITCDGNYEESMDMRQENSREKTINRRHEDAVSATLRSIVLRIE